MERTKQFTLIELFLTIGIIAMVGGLLVIRAQPMIARYQKSHALSKLSRELDFSQHLSEAAHAEIIFEIEETNKGLKCIRKTDEPLHLKGTIGKDISIPHLHLLGRKKVRVTYFPTGIVYLDEAPKDQEKTIIEHLLGREKK
ncbi:MAG: type II secretion system protein [Chlamydiia bacterium]|nr:type II secretion system protein [Chlamydiia bacterium]